MPPSAPRALWMAAKLLESPVEHLKEESRHFLFKELFCLQLKCCCSSLLGGRSLLWLHDSATSDWSPWGTTINTLLWQPDGPQQPFGSAAVAWDGGGDGMAWVGCSPRDGTAFHPGEISTLDTSSKLFLLSQSTKLSSTQAQAACSYFALEQQPRELPCPVLLRGSLAPEELQLLAPIHSLQPLHAPLCDPTQTPHCVQWLFQLSAAEWSLAKSGWAFLCRPEMLAMEKHPLIGFIICCVMFCDSHHPQPISDLLQVDNQNRCLTVKDCNPGLPFAEAQACRQKWGGEKCGKKNEILKTFTLWTIATALQSLSSLCFLPRGAGPLLSCVLTQGPKMWQFVMAAASDLGGTSMVFLGILKNSSPCSHNILYGSNQFPLLFHIYYFISCKHDYYRSAIWKKILVRKSEQPKRQSRNTYKHPFISDLFP